MAVHFVRIISSSLLFCLGIFCQTCSTSQHIDGTENWVEFKETVKQGDPNVLNSELEGEPVYLTGVLKTDQFIKDDKFGVAYKGLSLKRDAQIYQWFESVKTSTYRGPSRTGRKSKGSTTRRDVSYYTKWTFSPNDHENFEYPEGHENEPISPREMNVKLQADYYKLGEHQIAGTLFGRISYDSARLEETLTKLEIPPNYEVEFTENGLYLYADSSIRKSPKIGDIRYIYTTSNNDQVSLIAGQSGNLIGSEKSKVRSAILAGTHSLGGVINNQVNELKESSNVAIYLSVCFVFLSMLILDGIMKAKLYNAPVWRFFINTHMIVSSSINTVWCYGIIYVISLSYNDFSQAPLIVLSVFLSFAVFFAGWILFFGQKRTPK